MRSITPHLTSEFYNNGITAKNVASNNAYDVSTYSELRRIIAKLSYANKDYLSSTYKCNFLGADNKQ